MVQSNKILTVSYGTFSCTLEGFDDAFGTMKAIAEYFRDLAAEDRYFGAEPPQPDADMLAHIAQKEIARRVEAHRDETGFVLRAEEPAVAPTAVVTAAAAADAVDDLREMQSEAPVIEETEEPAEEVMAEETLPTQDDAPLTDDAAEAEPVDEPVAEAEEEDLSAEESPAEEDLPAAESEEPVAEAGEIAEAEEDVPAVEPEEEAEEVSEVADEDVEPAEAEDAEVAEDEATEDAVAAFFADSQDDADGYEEDAYYEDVAADDAADLEEEAPEPEPAPVSAAESIAAKLQRIRAVVSRRGLPAAEQDFTEDEHAEADVTQAIGVAIEASSEDESEAEEIIAPVMAEPAEELETEAAEPEDELDDIAEDESGIEAEDTLSAILSEAPETPDDAAEEEPRAEARVVKVTREEFDAILAADRDEAEAETEVAETEDSSDTSLSDEDEADLMRELAEVEADMAGEDLDEDLGAESIEDDDIESIFAESEADEDAEEVEAAPAAGLSADADADADVARLLDEADDKLDDDETSSRRSEFAHLRAAMAAGKAEEAAGGSMSETASDGDYREDLARVVRPRRPESTEPRDRTNRPQDEKPAPLKLVAAQRVDAEVAPVQPRRVMSAPIEDMSEESADGKMKFADYAASLGAVDLPDLLEAAASYLSFVEGQEQFSRPQLMTKVRMVEKEDFSREDGLRSFGLLLRDGKIEKTQAGRFTVSDRIGFRPEDARAAG